MINDVYLSLGSNQGDRIFNLDRALNVLRLLSSSKIRISGLYETSAQGFRTQPHFINMACGIWTTLGPYDLLDEIQTIEKNLGRTRPFINAPRSMDIDIVFFGNMVLQSKRLTIPHPSAHIRKFVLAPLMELCPEYLHPKLRMTVRELVKRYRTSGEIVAKVNV